MQSHPSNSMLEVETTSAKLHGCGGSGEGAAFIRDLPLCTVTKKSSLKLPAPRKIMGRDDTKLKQQFTKNHTEKHYTHIHKNSTKHLTIISFSPHASPVR